MTSRQTDDIAGEYRVVAMCGVSGSGKTYLARQLERAGFVRISSDEIIWQRYGDTFPELDQTTRQQAFQWAAREIDARAVALIKRGERIVVDSTMCKRVRRQAFRSVCTSSGADPLFIYLKTPLDILLQRLKLRKGEGPDDQIVSETQVRSFFAGFQPPDTDEHDVITIE